MNKIKVGINGFGRIGRLTLRAAWGWPELEFVAINDPGADTQTFAHLLNFDSIHGCWSHEAEADGDARLLLNLAHSGNLDVLTVVELALRDRPIIVGGPVDEEDLEGPPVQPPDDRPRGKDVRPSAQLFTLARARAMRSSWISASLLPSSSL